MIAAGMMMLAHDRERQQVWQDVPEHDPRVRRSNNPCRLDVRRRRFLQLHQPSAAQTRDRDHDDGQAAPERRVNPSSWTSISPSCSRPRRQAGHRDARLEDPQEGVDEALQEPHR